MAGRTQDPQREKKAASSGSARADGAKTTTGRTKTGQASTRARSAASAGTKAPPKKSAGAKPPTAKKVTGADAATRVDYYREMALIREFEQRAGEMYQRAKIGGYCHLNLGEEPTVVGLMTALRPTDYLFTNYRDHGYAIARGMGADRVMAELFGRSDGVSKGLGGSMHMYDASKRMLGGYGIVGGQIPPATGAALALTLQQKPGPDADAVMCQMGDGTTNIGAFHEALNIAAIWKLPIVYVIINNGLGMATTVEAASGEPELYKRGCSYRIPGRRVDGSDPEAVRQAADEMLNDARENRQPGILEVMSYRLRGHSVVDPARYRSKEEVAELKEHDPLPPYRAQLVADGLLDEKQAEKIEGDAAKQVADAIAFADSSPEPAASTLFDFTYATDVPNASRLMPGDPVLPAGWDREPVGAGKEA
ncbi:pyruvate dehydrogenase (acetyl-transferring) E1 component subunit alpha [Microbacterium protaetiae]|uniref:Pyruvate dehydrogenase (Acetyl-transferring) E1 component subunit alpha n=1 Tax=Microbacterium protaetiae TaxID=2509458 RepID=A0A4P6EFM7_9MICO|nr:thiamine pyrophosphate-dependent enzyme [Microbacterium protaetiae]QAY60213.1 pyruvate dehydrogenase (acetyl-transferring) E1 component subunit alpha [Microbacterium protaetiae]